MITKIFEIITKTGKAEKDLKKVSDGVEKVNEGLETTNKETKKLGLLGKGFGAAKKGAKGLGNGIKSITKAAGVFTLIALALGKLKELFEQNQKVVDIFNIAFESLAIAFNDFFTYISKNIGAVTSFFKSIFDDPLESLKTFATAIKDNIIERVKSAIEAFGFLALAMKKLFARDFKGALEAVKEAGKELVDVATGVDNSTEKISKTVKKGVEALTEYTKSTVKQAAANVELQKSAELAAVANQGLIEKYDLQAESLRQIRDDERNSIADRKKANDELAIVLEQQEAAMLSNAKISLRAAKAELQKDKNNIEFKKAVMEAENELVAVRAQVAGFRSEQQANDLALSKEEMEMTKSKLESEANLSIEQKRFNAEQIQDNLQRLEKQKEIDAEEREMQTTRLQGIVSDANAGTQAKIDAEIALNEFTQANNQQIVTRDAEIAAAKKQLKDAADAQEELDRQEKLADAEELNQAIIDGVNNSLDIVNNLAEMQKVKYENLNNEILSAHEELNAKILANDSLTEAEKSAQLKKSADEKNKLINENNKQAKKAFDVQKKVSIAQALIDTFLSAQASFAALAGIPIVGPALGGIAAAAAITGGLLNVQSIKNQKFEGAANIPSPSSAISNTSTSGGGGSPSTSQSQAPSFNVVGQSGFNQVAGALGSQPPVQAFVVAGAVTNAQQLQNNTINQATF